MHRPGGAVSLAVGLISSPNCLIWITCWVTGITSVSKPMFHHDINRCWYSRRSLFASRTIRSFHLNSTTNTGPTGAYGCAALILYLGYLVLQGNIGIIWPLFGVSTIIRYYDIGRVLPLLCDLAANVMHGLQVFLVF